MTKSEQDGNHPASHFLVVEDPEHPSTWHLRVRDASGALNHTLMGAAWAALHGGYRGNKYEGPGKAEALAKLKELYESEGMELPTEARDSGSGPRGSGRRHLAVLLNGPGSRVPDTEPRTGRYEIPICVAGSWVKDGYKLSITADDLAVMMANFEKRKNQQVVIDYEHASEHPEIARGGAVPAAGWIHALRVESNGHNALLASVEWTPEAEGLIKGGQYRLFSPAIDWSCADKSTGEPQGATLTSGALTNHPFLEELPPIMLSDLAADISTGYFDQPLKTVSVGCGQRTTNNGQQGAKMAKSTKLSIKKMTADDSPEGTKGHHGIFDGDDFVGHVTADDLKNHVKSCMEDGYGNMDDLRMPGAKGQAGIKGHQEPDGDEAAERVAATLLRDSGLGVRDSGKAREEAVAALKLATTQRLVEQREAARGLLLTECLKPATAGNGQRTTDNGQFFDTERAKVLLRENKITAVDLLDAIEAKDALQQAVTQGKVLPKDRAFFFEIALSNPKKFSEYIAGAVPVLRLGTVGLGDAQQLPVDQEVDIETKKLMSEKKLNYGRAMKEVFRSNSQLEERYRAAHRQEAKDSGPATTRDGAGAGITQ
jgi:phage I-like protein